MPLEALDRERCALYDPSMNDAAPVDRAAETNPTPPRTARQLRDAADWHLHAAALDQEETSRERSLKLGRELSILADVTHSIEGTEHYRAQEAAEGTEGEFRKLAEKYESALNSILGIHANNPGAALSEIRYQAGVALGVREVGDKP